MNSFQKINFANKSNPSDTGRKLRRPVISWKSSERLMHIQFLSRDESIKMSRKIYKYSIFCLKPKTTIVAGKEWWTKKQATVAEVSRRRHCLSEETCYTYFLYKQPSCYRSNVKNGLKVKQLAKQPPTLKTRIQKNFVELWVNNLTFSILSSLKLNLSTAVFGTT